MANSPGPSFTQNDSSQRQNSTPNTDQKKHRNRRRYRTPKKERKGNRSSAEKDLNRSITEIDIKFTIGPVEQPFGTFYRYRNESLGPIRIQSFIENGRIPCILFTKGACDSSVLEAIEKLTIKNGISKVNLHRNNVRPVVNNFKPPLKQRNRRIKGGRTYRGKRFRDYLSKEEVEEGLSNGTLIRGIIRINPKNSKESYVGNEDVTKTDYMITSVADKNRALEGDEVVLRCKAGSEDKKSMEVVYIIKKVHPRTAIGFLSPFDTNREYAIFTPRDKRVPKIMIPRINWPSGFQPGSNPYENILFAGRITEWKETRFALGVLTENLGVRGDLRVESMAILKEFNLDPTPYDDSIKQFLPKSSKIPQKEIECREDVRKECVFTIDPLTARDLDDAVSCIELTNGNYEIGVHISDVSYYLAENTKLDAMVKNKATTIYMVDTAYHMLPVDLCLHCSLLPGQDKLTFSVFWEMTPDGEVLKKRITRSVINSCTQLAYEHAQMMIDDSEREFGEDDLPPIHNGYTSKDLSRIVNILHKIAMKLRRKRAENGSLKIDQVKILFSLDAKTGEPTDFWTYENKPSHQLIEEFMLLANITVAEAIYDAYPKLAFLRLHEPPKPTMMVELQRNLESVGMHFDISSSAGIQSSLNKYISDDSLGISHMAVLNHLIAKPMKRARYFCSGVLDDGLTFNHYALSIPIYTHFTSPIRRYADIVVHRLLAASLNYQDCPNWEPEEVGEIAEICNKQKYHAKRAGEASSDLYLAHYVERHSPYVQDAVVVDVKERSVDVIVLSTGNVIRLYNNHFGENVKYVAEEINSVESKESNNVKKMWRIIVSFPQTKDEEETMAVLEIFSVVKVELSRIPKTNKLEAKLLRPLQSSIYYKQ